MFASKTPKRYASNINTYHQNKYKEKNYDVRNILKKFNFNIKKVKKMRKNRHVVSG